MIDYAVPSASWLPTYELDETVTPSPVNPLGVKGVGEAGTIASTPAVVNAVVDALSPLGIRHIDMPLTPQRVWRAMQVASGGAGHDPGQFRLRSGRHRSMRRSSLLGRARCAKLIAGGHSLLPLMKLRLARAGRAGRHRPACRAAGHREGPTAAGSSARSRPTASCSTTRPDGRTVPLLREAASSRSATSRCATAAPWAGPSRMPTRPPTSRQRCSPSTARSCCAARAASAPSRSTGSSTARSPRASSPASC